VVFGYACHNTTLSLMEWSGDYAGFAQRDLEQANPGCQAMYWAGCGADQNPLPRRTVELAEEYGRQLAGAVQAVINGAKRPVGGTLETVYEEVPIPFAALPSAEKLKPDLASTNPYIAATAKLSLDQINDGSPLSPTYPYPMTLWKLGDEISWVFLGGEVVVDYAIRLKSEWDEDADPRQVWVSAYSNDVMAYIPSRRILLEGGYEGQGAMVYYGLPSAWAEEIEEMIISTARKLKQ